MHEDFKEYDISNEGGSGVYHDAGYDALVTGITWVKLMTHLNKK